MSTKRGIPLQWLRDHIDHKGNDCLIWPFFRRKDGYGFIRFNGVAQTAARAMCVLVNGDPPTDKHHAAHLCGCGHFGCVNPQHIRWATASENACDKKIHGTLIRGSKSKLAKLSEGDIALIKSLNGKLLRREIGEKFGVSRQSINDVIWGRSWGWL